ncbi:12917_t:CDS:2, partial [Racocetra persica]
EVDTTDMIDSVYINLLCIDSVYVDSTYIDSVDIDSIKDNITNTTGTIDIANTKDIVEVDTKNIVSAKGIVDAVDINIAGIISVEISEYVNLEEKDTCTVCQDIISSTLQESITILTC